MKLKLKPKQFGLGSTAGLAEVVVAAADTEADTEAVVVAAVAPSYAALLENSAPDLIKKIASACWLRFDPYLYCHPFGSLVASAKSGQAIECFGFERLH